ncbi:hypothetical protein M0804_003647 [Polistes exclamans]|nr:hypothetical protein M0804_003647 [Polistes exclamans]
MYTFAPVLHGRTTTTAAINNRGPPKEEKWRMRTKYEEEEEDQEEEEEEEEEEEGKAFIFFGITTLRILCDTLLRLSMDASSWERYSLLPDQVLACPRYGSAPAPE